ncbi:MAG: hypothetical protein KDA28_04060 [Phycisphaerales bacterium]|nr:hypothetical protein [Phycisphaerales bacterium]
MTEHRDISDMLDALADLDGAAMPPDLPARLARRIRVGHVTAEDDAPVVATISGVSGWSPSRWTWPLSAAAGFVLLATITSVLPTTPRAEAETIAIADEVESALVLCAMFDGSMDEEIDLLYADTATMYDRHASFADAIDAQVIDLDGSL